MTRRSPETKILAVSGGGRLSGKEDYLELALQLGAHDALAKPFGKKALAAKVTALAKSRAWLALHPPERWDAQWTAAAGPVLMAQ